MNGAEEPPDDGGGEVALPVQFYLPPDQEAGVYAHAYAVWHAAYDFIIDFAVTEFARATDPEDPTTTVIPARIVARVRLPPGVMFDLIRTINATMTRYEAEWGEIARPERQEPGEG